jgi:hypothetical protein
MPPPRGEGTLMAKSRKTQPDLDLTGEVATETGKVECLGLTFDSEEARREYFTRRLREKLKDPVRDRGGRGSPGRRGAFCGAHRVHPAQAPVARRDVP